MDGMEYFYELFEALPRGGPGDNKSTKKAFNTIPKRPEQPLILDIGCGPGAQTIELAKLSKGTIIALDNDQAFLNKLVTFKSVRMRNDSSIYHVFFTLNKSPESK